MNARPTLNGRRIAVLADSEAPTIERALTEAGASVERLVNDRASASLWHSEPYAALVLVGALPEARQDKALQLTREFLVADKPIAAHGGSVTLLLTSGGVAGRTIATDERFGAMTSPAGATASHDDVAVDEVIMTARENVQLDDFARRAIQHFSRVLEERRVDEMSDLSFPASDPPAASPAAAKPVSPAPGNEPRP
jgi:putative intracellular protease/amidase